MNDQQPFQQYICRACGLIYDEAEGDPDSGLAPGTRFEDIPDDWECPLCGVTKSDFELLEKKKVSAAPVPVTCTNAPGVIVVGAGLAGWAAVEALRELDTEVAITLVCACTGDRYHKPELSVALGRDLTAESLVRETAAEAAKRLGVQLLSHTFVTGLTPETHQLRTTRGSLTYTKLILAQGSRAYLPEHLDPDQCWRVNDLRSWEALAERLRAGPQKVAIIGAGMIGCEIAEDIRSKGHEVTLINRDAYPLAHLLPEKAGRRLLHNLSQHGIRHLGDETVAGITVNPEGQRVLQLLGGAEMDVDQVIVATGLRTENRLAGQAGLRFDRGIVVDPKTLRTSARDIYALGDCISIQGQPCRFIEPILHQAQTIAYQVLGKGGHYYDHFAPVVRLKTPSSPLLIHGFPRAGQPWETLVDDCDQLVMEQRNEGQVVARLQLKDKSRRRVA